MRIFEITRKKKTLYLSRNLKNTSDILEWAKEQGFVSTLDPDDFHVTITYSKTKLDWNLIDRDDHDLVVPTCSKHTEEQRSVERFDGGATVLKFKSEALTKRWQEIIDLGATSSYPDYKSHVTISYKGEDLDVDDMAPYWGELVFGPEKMKEVDSNWSDDLEEVPIKESLSHDFAFRKIRERAEPVLSEMRKVEASRVSVFINPSQNELFSLMDRFDELRGLIVGREVFVWDSENSVHMEVMHDLGLPSTAYANRFACFWKGTNSLDWFEEWSDPSKNIIYDLHGVLLSLRKSAEAAASENATFARLVR